MRRDTLRVAVIDALEGVVDEEAGGVFLGQGNGVLKVEHYRVGAVDMGVGHHAGIVSRHEHHSSS